MNARQKMNLISRLRHNKVSESNIDKLFNLAEKYLNKLCNISNNDLFINEVSKLLHNNEKYGFYLDELSKNKDKFTKEDYKEAIYLIKNSVHNFNAKYVYLALKNELLQNNNLNLVGARIIFMAKREVNAEYAFRVLGVSKLLELGIAIPLAELIVGTENREECLNIIKNVLSKDNNLQIVSEIITKVTINLRKNLINMPEYEKDATDVLNIFNERLNKPLVSISDNEDKKRIRKKQ